MYYQSTRWTSADLELLPDNGNRYEIIDGELLVTRAPHWKHQNVIVNLSVALVTWSRSTGLGKVSVTPGIIFPDDDNVIPDLVWISNDRLAQILDDSGHLVGAPELVVEVLSAGSDNERRDREVKRKLYADLYYFWIIKILIGIPMGVLITFNIFSGYLVALGFVIPYILGILLTWIVIIFVGWNTMHLLWANAMSLLPLYIISTGIIWFIESCRSIIIGSSG